MWSTYALAILAVAGYVSAYGSGAPPGACQDMIPRHPVGPQNSTAPYKITTNTRELKAGSSLEVTVSGNKPTDTMRGLLMQARMGDKIVGKFTVSPDDKFAQTLDCDAPADAITHKKHDAQYDRQTVSFVWTAPANLNGNIRFRATIAYSGPVFWVGVESPQVKVYAN